MRTHPRAKLAPATKLSFISRWIRWLDLKVSSSSGKLPGRGLRGSMTEYMVVRDLRQPSTASPICWARSWSSTIARRRRGSDHKLSIPSDAFSRAVFRSATRRASAAKSRQVPKITKILDNSSGIRGNNKGCKEPHIATSRGQTRQYQWERSHILWDAWFLPSDPTPYPQERISVS
jgi:hypothetical protein